jgi:hemerythrin
MHQREGGLTPSRQTARPFEQEAMTIAIDWEQAHSVGIRDIDEQHKTLIDCISSVAQAVAEHDGAPAVHRTLALLVSFAQLHFVFEESLMRAYHYHHLDEHTDQHWRISEELESLYARSLTTGIPQNRIVSLRECWAAHIPDHDRPLGLHVLQRIASNRSQRLSVLPQCKDGIQT